MGSSFLTAINLALGLYCVVQFFKTVIQFGLPNHPGRFTLYLISLSVTAFFSMKALVDLNLLHPFLYVRWRTLPLVTASLGIILQVITIIGHFSYIQQKIISRLPIMGALLFFAFFWEYAEWFAAFALIASFLFLTISVGKARYQKRAFIKMCLFLGLFGLFKFINLYWAYIMGELFLFPALFYFFVFQQSYGVSTLADEWSEDSGVSA
jgi:hypothetical protein